MDFHPGHQAAMKLAGTVALPSPFPAFGSVCDRGRARRRRPRDVSADRPARNRQADHHPIRPAGRRSGDPCSRDTRSHGGPETWD